MVSLRAQASFCSFWRYGEIGTVEREITERGDKATGCLFSYPGNYFKSLYNGKGSWGEEGAQCMRVEVGVRGAPIASLSVSSFIFH